MIIPHSLKCLLNIFDFVWFIDIQIFFLGNSDKEFHELISWQSWKKWFFLIFFTFLRIFWVSFLTACSSSLKFQKKWVGKGLVHTIFDIDIRNNHVDNICLDTPNIFYWTKTLFFEKNEIVMKINYRIVFKTIHKMFIFNFDIFSELF